MFAFIIYWKYTDSMELYAELERRLVSGRGRTVISVTGGGGKTTLLRLFGRYLSRRGYSVLITTTTKIQSPDTFDYGVKKAFTEYREIRDYEVEPSDFVFYAERHPSLPKMIAPKIGALEDISKRFDVTLIEADGSRHLPLKIHTERDPVILPGTNAFIGIFNTSCIGRKAGDVTFGLEGDMRHVDTDFLKWYFNTGEGALKGWNRKDPGVMIFNGADDVAVPEGLLDFDRDIEVIVASEERNEIYSVL